MPPWTGGKRLAPLRINSPGRKTQQYSRTIPEIMDAAGNPLPDVECIADAWVKAFAEIEGGHEVTPDTLANIVLSETVRAVTTHASGPLGDVLSKTQIEELLRQTKSGSAARPNGGSVDLLRLAHTWSAVQLSILYLKTTLHIATPIQYRGGPLFELCKGKGHHWDMTKYRSILLADSIGKVSARARRRASAHHLAQEFRSDLSMQRGGVPGLGSEFPVIAVSMLQERAKARGESIGLLYVDAIQAFYAVLRSHLVAVTESDEAVAYLFAQLKLPASAFDELRTILAQGSCFNQSDINQAICLSQNLGTYRRGT